MSISKGAVHLQTPTGFANSNSLMTSQGKNTPASLNGSMNKYKSTLRQSNTESKSESKSKKHSFGNEQTIKDIDVHVRKLDVYIEKDDIIDRECFNLFKIKKESQNQQ